MIVVNRATSGTGAMLDGRRFAVPHSGYVERVRSLRLAASLVFLLGLGVAAGAAVAGGPSPIIPTLSVTLPVSTSLPITVTLPVTTIIPTTVPQVTTILPVTTALPVPTTLPQITTALPPPSTTVRTTTSLPQITTTPPPPSTTVHATTTLPQVTTVVGNATTAIAPAPQTSTATPTATAPNSPTAAAASLFSASPPSRGATPRRPATVRTLRAARTFVSLSGPQKRRSTVLLFRLSIPGKVRLTIVEVAPRCRRIGAIQVRGHVGTNRLRLGPRVHGRRLEPGTYEVGVLNPQGKLVRTRLAIFAGRRPNRLARALALRQNVCGQTTGVAPAAVDPIASAGSGNIPRTGVLGATARGHDERFGIHTLAAPVVFARDAAGTPLGQILLFVLAGALLAVSALPTAAVPDRRLAAAVSLRRVELATAGLSVLLGVLAVLLLN